MTILQSIEQALKTAHMTFEELAPQAYDMSSIKPMIKQAREELKAFAFFLTISNQYDTWHPDDELEDADQQAELERIFSELGDRTYDVALEALTAAGKHPAGPFRERATEQCSG